MKYQVLLLSLVLLIAIAGTALTDGFIIVPPAPSRKPFIPLSIKYHHVDINITDQVAVTKVDQVFTNENNRDLEGIYIFPIPEGAAISSFSMFIDGKPVPAEILEKKKAREIYEDIVRRMKDPALLEYVGRDAFKARVYPIPARGEKRIQIEYSEVLKYDTGMCKYVYPLNTEKFSAKPIQSVSVSVKIKSQKPIKTVYSPSHEMDIHKTSDHAVSLGYEVSDAKPDKDMIIYYTLSDSDFGLNLLAYRKKPDNGFFMLMIAPRYELKDREILQKDIIFVLDKSGSMKGSKLKQAKGALKFCIQSLNPGDRFGIISFSTDVNEFNTDLLPATPQNIREAIKFIGGLSAAGGTDIDDALHTALAKTPDPARPRMIVFLTDGLPTVGERNVRAILERVKQTRRGSIRLFTFGVGYDVNTHFLDELADTNNGVPQYVEPSEDIEVAVSNFYEKISEPVLSELKLDMGGIQVDDVYPKSLPDHFKGSQLIVMGRYSNWGETKIRLEGSIRGKTHIYTEKAVFPEMKIENDFIPRLWAQRKIGYLLDEIRSNGEDDELKDEIVRLSKKYGIITPYTSFLVLPDEEAERVPIARRAEHRRAALDRFSQGLKRERGRSAVTASEMLARMKSSAATPQAVVAAAPTGGVSGKGQTDVLVKYVGAKSFFFKKGYWVDSQYEQEMKTLKVVFGSEEYFRLLSQEPDLGKYFALGKKLIVCFKGTCYKVEQQMGS